MFVFQCAQLPARLLDADFKMDKVHHMSLLRQSYHGTWRCWVEWRSLLCSPFYRDNERRSAK